MSLNWAWPLGLVLVASSARAAGSDQRIDPIAESSVRTVLKVQAYPWYDGEKDQIKPLLPDPSSWTGWLEKRFERFSDWLSRPSDQSGSGAVGANRNSLRGALPTLLFVASGCVLLVVLWRLWRHHQPQASSIDDEAARVGEAARIAGLAPGVALEGVDSWAEALRRRAAGDPAGAVIWLFLDQLLGLQRAGLIRLTPGRTARQYASGLDDPLLGAGLRATLGVFEQVYYGHRMPGPEELERVWSRAEAMRRRLRTIMAEGRE
jgi:Domain of unknown function (DUF4129)